MLLLLQSCYCTAIAATAPSCCYGSTLVASAKLLLHSWICTKPWFCYCRAAVTQLLVLLHQAAVIAALLLLLQGYYCKAAIAQELSFATAELLLHSYF